MRTKRGGSPATSLCVFSPDRTDAPSTCVRRADAVLYYVASTCCVVTRHSCFLRVLIQATFQHTSSVRKHGVISIAGNTVFCPKTDLSSIFSFDFDACYSDTVAHTAVFDGSVAPLVSRVVAGDSSGLILCGHGRLKSTALNDLAYGAFSSGPVFLPAASPRDSPATGTQLCRVPSVACCAFRICY